MNRFIYYVWYKIPKIFIYLFLPFSLIYFFIISIRKSILTKAFKPYKSSHQIIIVGNLNIGGSGKTPFTIWLCNELTKKGKKIAIISSGYKSRVNRSTLVKDNSLALDVGDEAVLLKEKTKATIVSGKNRVDSTKYLERYEFDYIIHDDGLQHYSLARDLEFIIDLNNKKDVNNMLLPCGPYREPKMFHSESIYIKSNYYKKDFPGFFSKISDIYSKEDGTSFSLSDSKFNTINLVTGIADTSLIKIELISHNIKIIEHRYNDHHNFSKKDFPNNKLPILITEKDYVKIKNLEIDNIYVLKQTIYPNEKLKNMIDKF